MRRRGAILRAAVPAAVLLMLTLVVRGGAGPEADPEWLSWTRLHLDARSSVFLSGKVEMQLSHEGGKRLLETRTVARFFGARIAASRTRTSIDPASGRSESYESFTKKRGRRYCFDDRGYVVEKLLPGDRGAWETVSRHEYAYPLSPEGRPLPLWDYYGMILQLRRLDLHRPGDGATLQVATSRGPRAYRIEVAEERLSRREIVRGGASRPLTMELRELRLRVRPEDPEHADEGFLKMEGETELWVEAGSKTLLELSGKVPRVPGRVRLVLTEIE